MFQESLCDHINSQKNQTFTLVQAYNSCLGGDSSLETWMTCAGHYEIKPPIDKKFIDKTNVYILKAS